MSFQQALPYLITVYIGIWLGLFVYLLVIQGKLSSLRKQVEVLNRAVEKQSPKVDLETANA